MLIELKDVRLQFGSTVVLHNVNMTLNPGEIYGLLGPNGAGKSTTIAAALGLLKPTGGTVRVLGYDPAVQPVPVHRQVGVLPENNGFYGWMTGPQYLRFFARLYGRRINLAEITSLMGQVGLTPESRKAISTYSRGMAQRLGLARALLPQPKLLVLDEPTNGLDPRGRREIHNLLIQLSVRNGVGILLCTHLLDDVERLCHRIGVLVAGRTVGEGSISDMVAAGAKSVRFRLHLRGQPPTPAAVPEGISMVAGEGDWWIAHIAQSANPDIAWKELLAHGWPIIEVVRLGGGLEDLYFTLTEAKETP